MFPVIETQTLLNLCVCEPVSVQGLEPNTCQEVKDGHVDDVEQPVAGVVWIHLFHTVTVERIHFPPFKYSKQKFLFIA